MRHVDLDPVRAMVELLPCRLARFYRAIHNLGSLGHVELGSIAFQRITACGRYGAGRDEQARPWNIASLDGLLYAHIAITGAFSLHVAQGSETLLQRPPRRYRGPRRTQGERGVQDVGIVSTLRGIFALQKDVSVGIDETGQDRGFRQINDNRAGRNPGSCRIANALDAIAVDDDHLVAPWPVGFAVDKRTRPNDGPGF